MSTGTPELVRTDDCVWGAKVFRLSTRFASPVVPFKGDVCVGASALGAWEALTFSRVIFVNRYFWPDQSATSRLLSDLAFELAEDFEIHVVTSRQLIDDASAALAAYETHRNVECTGYGLLSLGVMG